MPVPADSTKSPPWLAPCCDWATMDTTAGSTLASTTWMSAGFASTLLLGKNCSTSVRWLPTPMTAPTVAPTEAASTTATMTTSSQLRRVSV